jgi:hydrogenase maturation protease
MARILVAGVGNVLRGDDGFGVRLAQALATEPRLPTGIRVIETGIGGMSLVQELMDEFEALILLDAFDRGGEPGQIFVVEPSLPDLSRLSPSERRDYFSDTHYATPVRALSLAASLGRLPNLVYIVGCQPVCTDRFELGLDPVVEAAIPDAIERVLALIADMGRAQKPSGTNRPADHTRA